MCIYILLSLYMSILVNIDINRIDGDLWWKYVDFMICLLGYRIMSRLFWIFFIMSLIIYIRYN